MYVNIHLNEEELISLMKGGIFILTLPDGVRVIVKKDIKISKEG